MDLRQLRYFTAIVEEGSLSAAAVRLALSQPSLSEQIKQLEAEFRVALLHRTARGVTPTAAGQALVAHARVILCAVETAVADVRSRSSQATGHVRVGVPGTISVVLSVPIAESADQALPQIKVQLIEGMSGHVWDWLCAGTIDLALVYEPTDKRHAWELSPVLATEEVALFAAPDNWAQAAEVDGVVEESVSFAKCCDLPLVLPSRSHALRELIERFAREHGMALTVATEMDSLTQIKAMVVRGSGYTMLPVGCAWSEVRHGELIAVPFQEHGLVRTVHIAKPRDKASSPVLKEVERLIADTASDVVRRNIWRTTARRACAQPIGDAYRG